MTPIFEKDDHGYLNRELGIRVYREDEPNYPWVIALEHDEDAGVLYAKSLGAARDFVDGLLRRRIP